MNVITVRISPRPTGGFNASLSHNGFNIGRGNRLAPADALQDAAKNGGAISFLLARIPRNVDASSLYDGAAITFTLPFPTPKTTHEQATVSRCDGSGYGPRYNRESASR